MEEISGVGGEGVERIREVSWRRSIVRGEGSSGMVRRVAASGREDEGRRRGERTREEGGEEGWRGRRGAWREGGGESTPPRESSQQELENGRALEHRAKKWKGRLGTKRHPPFSRFSEFSEAPGGGGEEGGGGGGGNLNYPMFAAHMLNATDADEFFWGKFGVQFTHRVVCGV